ncbi:biotin-dependent enzyme [Lutibacter oceani]|uniref:Biotin-dependent enzyme n=1 Tax=Lutibacter oceani TaxID=1853311 RepID=A0A3D9RKE0_9FLAO|nr:acetyl-CoA carboxylase biotin carboxyl carrier protein subunit [Lutibacter oceani]REE80329.1 biotin-dependent enzyme [Lutibacter oceani]
MENSFNVKINDSFEFNLKEYDTEKLDVLRLSKTKFHVISNNKSFVIDLKKSDFNHKNYIVSVNSNSYSIIIDNQLDTLIKQMGFSGGTSKKVNDIKAPMPGLILSVNVKEGQEVVKGETLLILEAMKMENAIGAPKDGFIKTINIKKGGTVEKGALMIEMA